MPIITMPGMLLTGDHASRPAAADVGGGTLYACSDHDLIYQSDTSAWTTWATLGSSGGVATDTIWNAAGDLAVGTGSDTAARLAIGSNNDVLTSNGTTAVWAAPTGGSGAYLLHEEKVAPSGGSASFDWTSIPGTSRHIMVFGMIRSEKAAGFDTALLRLNNDSGSNYDTQQAFTSGTSPGGAENSAQTSWATWMETTAASSTAGIWTSFRLFIPYYASTVFQKICRGSLDEVIANSAGNYTVREVVLNYRSTSAITRVTLSYPANDIAEFSSASMYFID